MADGAGPQEPFPEEGSSRPGDCVLGSWGPGVHWGDEETETLLAILWDAQHHEKLQTREHSQTYRAMAGRLREQGFLRTPEQCRTEFTSLPSRYHKGRAGRVPEPCVLCEALSSSWASAPTVASGAVPGQEGRAAEPGELSQQNGEPTEVGEGARADGAAGDEQDFRDSAREGRRRDPPVFLEIKNKTKTENQKWDDSGQAEVKKALWRKSSEIFWHPEPKRGQKVCWAEKGTQPKPSLSAAPDSLEETDPIYHSSFSAHSSMYILQPAQAIQSQVLEQTGSGISSLSALTH
ncbi:hypothetical protein GH733_012317 [Mirounga leonina]|nr:hypothetical protein GH733_012317 [Mirounga leonina]